MAQGNTTPLYDIRPSTIDVGGKGLFATEDIEYGADILTEQPICTLETTDLRRRDRININALKSMSQEDQDNFLCLSGGFATAAQGWAVLNRSTYDPSNINKEYGFNIEGAKATIKRVRAIWDQNAKQIRSGRQSIFPTAARINHSCVPNAHLALRPNGSAVLVACKSIAQDQEITIRYTGPYWDYDERHGFLMAKHRFPCTCQLCSESDDSKVLSSKARKEYAASLGKLVITVDAASSLVENSISDEQAKAIASIVANVAFTRIEALEILAEKAMLADPDLFELYMTGMKAAVAAVDMKHSVQYGALVVELGRDFYMISPEMEAMLQDDLDKERSALEAGSEEGDRDDQRHGDEFHSGDEEDDQSEAEEEEEAEEEQEPSDEDIRNTEALQRSMAALKLVKSAASSRGQSAE